jgi:hypothetical protein
MTPILRKILVFVLQFAPLFLASIWLYLLILPYYHPIALGTANVVTERMSPPTRLEGNIAKMKSFVFTPQNGNRLMRRWGKTAGHLVFLSLALVPALLLATPAPIRTRFRLLAVGLPLVFLGHVLALIAMTRGIYALRQAPGTFYWLWILRMAYTSGQVVAATVVVLLTWRYWVPRDSPGGSIDS